MTDVQDPATTTDLEDHPRNWLITGIYAALIGANLWIAFDWWRDTEGGRAVIDKVRQAAAECEGCARRKAMLKRATARMHREAEQVILLSQDAVDEADTPTDTP